jgi:hypothetical protein
MKVTVIFGAILQQLDPAGEARERGPELMRGLACHAGQHPLALGVATCAHDIDAGEEQHERRRGLERGDDAQPFHERRIPEVDLSHEGVGHRRILPIQLADEASELGLLVLRAVEREVGVIRRPAAHVGDDDRHALRDDALGQIEQRLGARVRARVGLRAEHARIHEARALGLGAEVAHNASRVHDVRREKNGEEQADDQLGSAAAHRLADPVGPYIRPQHFRDEHRAVGLLVVLQDAREGAREREP